ncbi:MAG: hypothetical protein H7Y17_01835 [Chlorobia bacterium]|nr:hypothetical protein [Fimbriimonadaceae bacterium]
MFDFALMRGWKWLDQAKPMIMVDGRHVNLKEPGVVSGEAAYVVTVTDKNLDAIIDKLDVEALFVYEARITDVTPFTRLRNLKHLRIEWAVKLSDISPLAELSSLESLHLSDTPKMQDLSPVASLKELRDFVFEGGVWNRNTATSLEPLSELPKLEEVHLLNLKVLEDGLRPLAKCPSLRKLEVSNQFKTEDYAYLAGVRPDIACQHFAPWVPLSDGMVMTTGKGKRILHRIADYRQIEAAEAGFETLRQKFAAQGID